MLDSHPVKVIHLVSSLITIGLTVGGAFTGLEQKGDEWGQALAATVFAFGFAVAAILLWIFAIWAWAMLCRLKRSCPVCKGAGVVRAHDDIGRRVGAVCPKCGGEGRIW